MVIVTKTANKREISAKYGYKMPMICKALRFESHSPSAYKIRSIAMNEFKSFFLDIPLKEVHLKCRN